MVKLSFFRSVYIRKRAKHKALAQRSLYYLNMSASKHILFKFKLFDNMYCIENKPVVVVRGPGVKQNHQLNVNLHQGVNPGTDILI